MSRPVIWITGLRKWFLNWCNDFIATTSSHPSSSPTTLTSPNAVTACCGCTRAGPRRYHPVRLRIRGDQTRDILVLVCLRATWIFVRRSMHPRDGGRRRNEGFLPGRYVSANQEGRKMPPAEVTGGIGVRGICLSAIQKRPGA